MENQKLLLSFLSRCSDAFDVDEDSSLADRVLEPLFKEKRFNTDPAEVLGKVVALNGLYGTRVFDIYGMAEHIQQQGQHLDNCLRKVTQRRWVPSGDGMGAISATSTPSRRSIVTGIAPIATPCSIRTPRSP